MHANISDAEEQFKGNSEIQQTSMAFGELHK